MKLRFLILLSLMASLSHAQAPTLWGTTQDGGITQAGTIYKYEVPTNTFSKMHDFGGSGDGASPTGSLIQPSNGLLYGVTTAGGANGSGVIFSYDILADSETVLHSFGAGMDGIEPNGPLLAMGDTLLFGTTSYGGMHHFGTIFCYNISTGNYQDLFDFTGDSIYSTTQPMGPLMQASNGLLYGVNKYNGTYQDGGIFSYNINTGTETDVYSFNDTTGNQPEGGLIQASNGLLYGTSIFGGTQSVGTIFSYNTSTGVGSAVQSFQNNLGRPITTFVGSQLQINDSLLYGVTFGGGANNNGVIFNYNLSNNLYLVQHIFGSNGDGAGPMGPLIKASDGLLYGVTFTITANQNGTIFSFNPTTGVEVVLHDFGGNFGDSPHGALLEVDFPSAIHALTKTQLQIFPNPSTGQFIIQLPNNNGAYLAEVYNALGQKIEQQTLTATQNAINLNNQPTGMYFVSVQTETGAVSGKVMVVR